MPCLVGILLALGVAVLARGVGLDRDRSFYPTVLIVVAAYYPLFGALTGSGHTVLLESLMTVGFVVVAVVGFRWSPWLVVGGLAGHGVFDAVHGLLVENPGVPSWWPAFCLAYDVAAAAGLAWLLSPWRRSVAAGARATARAMGAPRRAPTVDGAAGGSMARAGHG